MIDSDVHDATNKDESDVIYVTNQIISSLLKFKKQDKDNGCKAWIGGKVKDAKFSKDNSIRQLQEMGSEVKELYEERKVFEVQLQMIMTSISSRTNDLKEKERELQAKADKEIKMHRRAISLQCIKVSRKRKN